MKPLEIAGYFSKNFLRITMLQLVLWLKRLKRRKQKRAPTAAPSTDKRKATVDDDTSPQTSNSSWTSYEIEGFAVIEAEPVRKAEAAAEPGTKLAETPGSLDALDEYNVVATPPSACDTCHIPTTTTAIPTTCSDETPFNTFTSVRPKGCGGNSGKNNSFTNGLFSTLSLTESVPQVEYLLNIAPHEAKGPRTTPASDINPVLVDGKLTVRQQIEDISKRKTTKHLERALRKTLKRKGSKTTARLACSMRVNPHDLDSPEVCSLRQPQFLQSSRDTQLGPFSKPAPVPTPISSEDQTTSLSAPSRPTLSKSPHTVSLERKLLLEAVDGLIEAFPDTVRQWRAREAENEEVALANAALDLIEAYTEVLKAERRRRLARGWRRWCGGRGERTEEEDDC